MGKSPALRKWAADEVTRWPVDQVRPYARNPRTHSDAQVRLIAQSIEQYGFTTPLLVDEEGVLLYGHGRLLAAQLLGLEEVPVAIARGWSDAEKSAYRIADNQLNLLSGWDMPMLKAELHDLSIDGSVELNTLGFPELQLNRLGHGLQLPGDPDAAPEPPAEPITKRGDLWLLGEHRLLCGDATAADDVGRLDGSAAMVFTDPPYGVAYVDGQGSANTPDNKHESHFGAMQNDDLTDDDALLRFLVAYMQVQPLGLKAAQYVFHPSSRAHVFRAALLQTGYKVKTQIVWIKGKDARGRSSPNMHYKYRHEPLFYATPASGGAEWYGDYMQTSVWESPVDTDRLHPTQKPVDLIVRAITNSSKKGDAVYEPFSGSGSTIIACEMTGRRCLAIEIEPRHVDVAVARWEQFVGKKAQRKTPRPKARGSLQCA